MLDEREELLLSVTLARKVVEEANAKQNVFSPFLLRAYRGAKSRKFYSLNTNVQERVEIRL